MIKNIWAKTVLFLSLMGPGIITAFADNDAVWLDLCHSWLLTCLAVRDVPLLGTNYGRKIRIVSGDLEETENRDGR